MKKIIIALIIVLMVSGTAWGDWITNPDTGKRDYYKDYDEAIANIEAGGLSGVDAIPGDTVDDGKLDSSLINVATSIGLGVASFPNTTFTVSTAGAVSIKANVFQPYSAILDDFSEGSPTGTYNLSGATITFGLEDADIPASIARDSELPTATSLHLDDVLTALGIESEAVHFGTFTGSTIGDNLTAKAIFQALATAIESIEGGSVTTSSPIGDTAFTDLAAGDTYTNFGDATDDTINELFAAIDASWPSGSGAPTDASYLTAGANATLSDERVVSADGLSLIQAADFATMRDSMGVQAYDTSLTNIAYNWTVDSSGNVSGMGTIEPTPTEHPQAVLYDSNAPGATTEEKAMAYLWAEYVDGADDAENSSAGIAARANGGWFNWIWYDKTVDQVKVARDLDVDGLILAHSSMGLEERINIYDGGELVGQITGRKDGVGVSQLTFSTLQGSTMTDFFTPCGNCGVTHFWKPIDLPASTASKAPLNISSGTAPSSPAEGDIYYDGTHLYFKPSGSAVDLLQTMVYPGAGVPVSTGSAWETSLTVGTEASNLVQLDESGKLPAVDGSSLTGLFDPAAPGAIGGTTPNTGTFTTLTADSLNITRKSGSATIAEFYEDPDNGDNKVTVTVPALMDSDTTFNLAEVYNSMTTLRDAVGTGTPGSGLPEGGTEGQVIIKGAESAGWGNGDDVAISYSPTDEYTNTDSTLAGHLAGIAAELAALKLQITTMTEAFNSLGLNVFFFDFTSPADSPYYTSTTTGIPVVVDVTCSNTTYEIDGVRYQVDSGGYVGNSLANTEGHTWEASMSEMDQEGEYTYQLEAVDTKGEPNTGESVVRTVIIDTTPPVIDLGAGANPTTHDGTGTGTFMLDYSAMVTELNAAIVQYRMTEGDTGSGDWTTWASPYNSTGLELIATTQGITIDLRVTDKAGRTGSDTVTLTYSGGGGEDSYSDIIFYWDCETTTVNKGNKTMSVEGSGTVELALNPTGFGVGSRCVHVDRSSSRYECSLAVPSTGRMGCYVQFESVAMYAGTLAFYDSEEDRVEISQGYSTEAIHVAGGTWRAAAAAAAPSLSTPYFIEMAWGGAANTVELYIDGVCVDYVTDALGTFEATPARFIVGLRGAYDSEQYIDQVFISTDPTRDLYAIRNMTSLSD